MTNIQQEIEDLWKKFADAEFLDHSNTASLDEWIHSFRKTHDVRSNTLIQPWYSIYEEAVSWLSLVSSLLQTLPSEALQQTPEIRPFLFLTANASSHAIALWELTNLGHDVSARIISRALLESLYAAIVMLHDEHLSKSFMTAAASEEATRVFWREHLKPGVLAKKISIIERSVGLDEDCITELGKMRAAHYRILSEFTHPSYLVGVVSALPIANLYPNSYAVGGVGQQTCLSRVTLEIASKTIWFYAMVVMYRSIQDDAFPQLESALSLHEDAIEAVTKGYEVLKEIVRKHFNDAPTCADNSS